jgi:hypothetical protein
MKSNQNRKAREDSLAEIAATGSIFLVGLLPKKNFSNRDFRVIELYSLKEKIVYIGLYT